MMDQRIGSISSSTSVPRYVIDSGWYEVRGISLVWALRQRRCLDCQSGKAPSIPKRSRGRKKFFDWEEEIQGIVHCCSQKQGYLTSHMTMLEAAFRLVAKGGNVPISVQDTIVIGDITKAPRMMSSSSPML